jgi:spore germination protein YaaH
VALTVTRFAWDSKGQASSIKLLSSSTARARLVREIVEQVRSRNVDGVNIDFEPIPGSQKQHFVTFVRALRRGLDGYRNGLDLTVAATGFVANYDVHGLTQPGAADAIFIMAYHYRGSWSATSGSIAPLSRHGYDLADTIAAYRKGAPASKLILGLPYYGYIWSTVDGSVRANTQSGSRVGYPASIIYRHAVTLAAKYGTRWDSQEQGPWVRWRQRACGSCSLVWREMYFDNARSFGLKLDLAVTQGLRGVGIWTLGYEGSHEELNDVLRTKLGGD